MESLFVRVLTLSLTGSAVLLPLLLLAPRLRGRYAAGTLSVLWLVLALRMALPVPLSLPWTAVTVDVSALPSVNRNYRNGRTDYYHSAGRRDARNNPL